MDQRATPDLVLAVGLFFGLHALGCRFDVADTHVLFGMAPAERPARMLVVARVVEVLLRGAVPLGVGVVLARVLAGAADPLGVYRVLFGLCAVAILAAILPLRAFRVQRARSDGRAITS